MGERGNSGRKAIVENILFKRVDCNCSAQMTRLVYQLRTVLGITSSHCRLEL